MRPDFFAVAVDGARAYRDRVLDAASRCSLDDVSDGPEASRPCEVCPRTAWFVEAWPEGVQSFMCSEGHLLIVAPSDNL